MKAWSLGGLIALASAAAVLAADATHPPPGEYQIDSETITTSHAGPTVLRSVQRVDGATGNITVEQSTGDGTTTRQTYPGQGPNRFCSASGPPPAGAVACANRAFKALPGGGSNQEAVCAGGQVLSANWRRLADGRWEHDFETQLVTAPATMDPRTTAAMAPVIAQIEEAIRTGPPAEAEAARQQLAALKASMGGGATGPTVSVRETWTKISDRCG